MQFLQELAVRAKPAAEKDLAELRAFASTLGIDDLKPWDSSYASEKLKQQKHNLSQETLRAYFPAPKVISGLFAIVEKLYGIEIQAYAYTAGAFTVGLCPTYPCRTVLPLLSYAC